MSIAIKTQDEIEKMRVAGKLAAQVLQMIEPHVKAGVTTAKLDQICADFTAENNALSAPLNYGADQNGEGGFPKSICTSVNHVVCHGIPSAHTLQDGDIVNIDITVKISLDDDTTAEQDRTYFHGDTSKMFLIGDVSPENRRLCRITQESLYAAIKKVKPGNTFADIGATIQKYIKKAGRYGIVKDFCGHGIGSVFHEEPQILHYKNADNRKMQPGMIFTIEPMINLGKGGTVLDKDDGWTAYTVDGKNSAQWEHTILVTNTGCEILTLRDDEKGIQRIMHN
ncbi:type I methionyl aminopeptidase [Thalassotalea sp. HSM 43]|uniref:type I methionyl aminopeptidase n=1 Tax=Thalassotalea sp. HSM 43 TaxID=2552945 RepID=UPI001081999F|nr:type I methionyl aminopeptidase [Thalassotalea sp. HSM 43]QBY05527.1 type I methionyl aminopeptidase [Thalassotalea sp. HSM 43]